MRDSDPSQLGDPPQTETLQLVCFVVGGHTYGLDIMRIAEVINPVPLTPIPGAPGVIEGIAELRGAFLAVVDLRRRFDRPAPTPSRETKYVVVTMNETTVGLIVDAVLDVRRVDVARIQPSPIPGLSEDLAGAPRLFSGVVNAEGGVVMILDLERVLSPIEKSRLDEVVAAQTGPDSH